MTKNHPNTDKENAMPATNRQCKMPLQVILTLTICLFLHTPAGCQQAARANVPDEDITAVVNSNNTFAWAMYRLLTADDDAGNVFFSPSSIHAALTMTYAGAREQTAQQMAHVLALPVSLPILPPAIPWELDRLEAAYGKLLAELAAPDDAGYELHVANSLWGQQDYPWRQELLDRLQEHFGAGLEEVDFAGDTGAARRTINTWVAEQTNEQIVDLIPEGMLGPLTRLVLTNAIYFKGDWTNAFDPRSTADRPFHISTDETIDVPLMRQTDDFGYAETDAVQVLRLPYIGDELSMIVILPKAVDGLGNVESSLAANGLGDLTANLTALEVTVTLPKFTMSSQFSLGDVLQAMGMTDAFNEAAADFTGLSERADDDGLHISAVVHQAFVDVNEEGTEAAAATGVGIEQTSVAAEPIEFTADHPFVFVIRHEATGAILFIGRVTDPSGQTVASDGAAAE